MNDNAIVVLTKGYDDIKEYSMLIDRNNAIYDSIIDNKHLLFKTDVTYDFLIFHEGNIPIEHQEYIQSKTQLPLVFLNVKDVSGGIAFDDSKNIMNYDLCPPTELSERFTLGYKHMCHFWAIDCLTYLSNYRYVVRIDEDCIIKNYNVDLIGGVIKQGIKLAVPYICNFLDHPDVMVGLEKLTLEFLSDNNVNNDVSFSDVSAVYTNFFIFDVQYFLNNKLVNDFLNVVDKSNGIYSNRWGDASTWAIIAYYLMGDNGISLLSDLKYYHASHGAYIN